MANADKKVFGLMAAVACLLAAPGVFGQDRIGYVNVMAVLEGTAEGKASMAKLKKEASAKEVEYKKRVKALGDKFKQFQSRAKMMKDDKAAEQYQTLQKEKQELELLGMQYQAEFQKKQSEALAAFQKKVQGVVNAVARREGLTWVMRQEVLLFGPTKMDITNQVIREYDKRFSSKKGKKKGK